MSFFPKIVPIPLSELEGGIGYVNSYWLLDIMNSIKKSISISVSNISSLDELFDIVDNSLDDFIDKLFDSYYYKISPHYDPTYTSNDFIADINFIRDIFTERIEELL